MALRAPDTGDGVRTVMEVRHCVRADVMHLDPLNRCLGLPGFEDLDDLGVVLEDASVAGRARGDAGQTGPFDGLGTAVAAHTLDLGLGMGRMIELDGLIDRSGGSLSRTTCRTEERNQQAQTEKRHSMTQDFWQRIDNGSPRGYWEEVATRVRNQIAMRLVRELAGYPAGATAVLGRATGFLRQRLAADRPSDSRVLAWTSAGDFVEDRLRGKARETAFRHVVCFEALEDLEHGEWAELLELLCEQPPGTLWVAARHPHAGRGVIEALLPPPLCSILDPVHFLRSLHTQTPLRLDRREEQSSRGYAMRLDILLDAGPAGEAGS